MDQNGMTLAELRADPVRAIELCLEREPLLYWGGVADSFYLRRYGREALEANRREMTGPKGVAQVIRAGEFIDIAPRRATVNLKRFCYGWKHVAERWHQARLPGQDYYIGEGSFLVACWAMGVLVKRHSAGGYQIGLSEAARELVA